MKEPKKGTRERKVVKIPMCLLVAVITSISATCSMAEPCDRNRQPQMELLERYLQCELCSGEALKSILEDEQYVPCLEAVLASGKPVPPKLQLDKLELVYGEVLLDAQRRGGNKAAVDILSRDQYLLREIGARSMLAKQRAVTALAKHSSGKGVALLRRLAATAVVESGPDADNALLELIESAIGTAP